MEQWLESNRVFEASQLNDISQQLFEILNNMDDIGSIYKEYYVDVMNIDHVDFIIKSEYMLGQISTILDHIKIKNFYVGVNNGSILFEMAFTENNGKFKMYKITDEGFNRIEQQITNL